MFSSLKESKFLDRRKTESEILDSTNDKIARLERSSSWHDSCIKIDTGVFSSNSLDFY